MHNPVDHLYPHAVDTSTKLWHISDPGLPFPEALLPLFPKRPCSPMESSNSLLITDSTILLGMVSLASLQFPGYPLETLQGMGVMLAISQASVTEGVWSGSLRALVSSSAISHFSSLRAPRWMPSSLGILWTQLLCLVWCFLYIYLKFII